MSDKPTSAEALSLAFDRFALRLSQRDVEPRADDTWLLIDTKTAEPETNWPGDIVSEHPTHSAASKALFEAGRALINRWGNAPELPEEMEAALTAFEEIWLAALAARPAAPEAQGAWSRTGSSRVPIGFGPGEWEWFRSSDGVLRNYPAGFNPNSGRYEGLTITSAPPSSGQE